MKKLNIVLLFLLILTLCFPLQTKATIIYIDSDITEFNIENEFQITVNLNTEEEYINAVEGKIIFPGDLLELEDIRDGNSQVNLWIERPHLSKRLSDIFPQEIAFSGITPGGLVGEKVLLLKLNFKTKKEGSGQIEIQGFKGLINDGKGTASNSKSNNFQFKISKNAKQNTFNNPKDNTPPEPFDTYTSSQKDVFNGKYFITFATQDKGSGIDYYEVYENIKEGVNKAKWEKTESPYMLKDQSLNSYIYVKAVDKDGNERISSVKPQKYEAFYKRNFKLITGILVIALLTTILAGARFVWVKKKSKH